MDEFKFEVGDVVLAEWEDKLFYAKIQDIDRVLSYCHLIFDDNSVEECPFAKIHSVTETTAEIVCIICKDGTSAQPNEIVLCDKCGIGYHQKCHDPPIPAKALELNEPWMCTYCSVGAFCPYLENPFEAKEKIRNEPLRRRRIHSLKGENNVVANSWNSGEHRLLGKRPVSHSMSGFYYTSSPSQHREGHRPRGRPPFSHKKHINDKRGRGIGRSPNRNSNREHQNDREPCDQDITSRKHHSKHSSEIQHRSHPRYSSPSRNNRHGEDAADSSGSDRSQSNKDATSPNPTAGRKSSENVSGKPAVVIKPHRRDAPREKQRLTQDLARQKRLLSEDIARDQLLQREQLTNNHDMADKKDTDSDSPQEQCDALDDLEKNSENSEKDTELTMYEKCYGNVPAEGPGDDSSEEPREEMDNISIGVEKSGITESLFDRILSRGSVKDAEHIEFVNESQLEMRSERVETDQLHGKSSSPILNATSNQLNRKVKLPVFENVTDEELTTSDNEGVKNLNDASSNGLFLESQVVSNVKLSDQQLTEKLSSEETLEKVTNTCSLKGPPDLDSIASMAAACECTAQDRIPSDNTSNSLDFHSQMNGTDSKSDQSDHSIIKASKITQVLEKPDIQCEHSFHESEGLSDEKESPSPYDLSKDIDNVEGNVPIKACLSAHFGGTAPQPELGSNHSGSLDNEANTEELETTKEGDNASLGQDTDMSNNEGMSDAEELSDLEPVTSAGKAKVKRKTRKKTRSSKTLLRVANSPQRQPRRSKTGRRLGRPPKIAKQPRQIESDSDEPDNLSCDIKNDKTECKEEPARIKPQSLNKELSDSGDQKLDNNTPADDSNLAEDNEMEPSGREGSIDESKEVEGFEDDALSPESLQHQDSDTEDASQEIFSLTETERLQLEEQGRKERLRKDKRMAARQKRKSVERDREKERATPPHLVSQNRFARDLPRHNWLVERLLQQKKLGQEALKPDSNQNSDNPDGNTDEELNPEPASDENASPEQPIMDEPETKSQEKLFTKDASSEGGDTMKEDGPASPQKDEFQSELHRSFLRRSFPSNVPRTPPKLKPASPENIASADSKSIPPPLKHKLQSKEHSALEPVPKLKKIVQEKTTKENEEVNTQEQTNDNESRLSPKESESTRKQVSPIEILDDDDERKKRDVDSKPCSPVITSFSSDKLASKDDNSSHKFSSFSPPKKLSSYPSPKKIVHSVSPTLPGSIKEIGSPHPMGPHHRAAILIPVVPMHDANGLPLPPSLGPPSPHLKPYSPRTFTPHLITHNPPFAAAGMFGGPTMTPTSRYLSGSCHHHFHPGIKPGPCKRDVNCPFHGSPGPRGLPAGILSIPSHHPSIAGFNPHGHGHEHISQMIAREHREGHCPNSDCKLCRQGKESPKIRELDAQSNREKTSPQSSKVVKPIAHVPGMRPPLMLSHLQQFGSRPAHGFADIDSLQEEKARRSGMDPLLSPRQTFNISPDRSPRDTLVPGLYLQDRSRALSQPLTLSDLNRRREQDLMKGQQETLLSAIKHRPIPGDFMVPGFSSPPTSLSKQGLIHPKDATLFTMNRGQPTVVSQAEKRDMLRMDERERSAFLTDSLKSGPPRLRSVEEQRDVLAMRSFNEQKRREEHVMRENSSMLRSVPKEVVGMPPAKLFEDRDVLHPRDQSMPSLSRSSKDFDVRLLSTHGNASILGPGLRSLDDHRKVPDEERKGIEREEREQGARRNADSETREREIREEQAMNALERRRSLEQMREKEQEKRNFVERDNMRGQMERDRIKNQMLRGSEAEKHFKSTFGIPRERSPPFLRRDMYQEQRLPDHRLDLRAAALHDLQRRQELFRAGEANSHRELLGRIASSHSANKLGHPGEKHFPDRFHAEMSRSLTDARSHSPSRGYPLSMASRQAMDRLAAAAQGKSIQQTKEMEKDIPPHLRTEMEREREKERHRLSLEQIDVNRRLLQAELKEKVNPIVLNREIGPRDREKEMATLRARERLMIERERYMALERLADERKRKRDSGELDGPFGMPGRHLPSPPFAGRTLAEFERAKRMRMSSDEHIPTSVSHGVHHPPHAAKPIDNKPKADDRLASPKGLVEQRIGRPLDLDLPNKTASSMLEREAMWIRERERVLRAREELSRMQNKVSKGFTNHLPGFVNSKDRPEGVPRDGDGRAKPEDETANLCSVCKRDASFLCSGCQGAWYCSAECQLSAWGKHSRDCGQSQRQ